MKDRTDVARRDESLRKVADSNLQKSTWRTLAAIVVTITLMTSPALAHHSAAQFDIKKVVTVSGVVKEWRMANPHALLVVVGRDGSQPEREWTFESVSSAQLVRMGVTRKSLQAGEMVTVVGAPVRSGAAYAWLDEVVKADKSVVAFKRLPGR